MTFGGAIFSICHCAKGITSILLYANGLVRGDYFSTVLVSGRNVNGGGVIVGQFFVLFKVVFTILTGSQVVGILLPICAHVTTTPFYCELGFCFFNLYGTRYGFVTIGLVFRQVAR